MQWNQNQIKLSNQISLVRSSQIKSNQVTSRHTNLHSYFGEEIMLHLEHYENSLKRNDQDQIIESNLIKSKLHTAYDSLICYILFTQEPYFIMVHLSMNIPSKGIYIIIAVVCPSVALSPQKCQVVKLCRLDLSFGPNWCMFKFLCQPLGHISQAAVVMHVRTINNDIAILNAVRILQCIARNLLNTRVYVALGRWGRKVDPA